MVYVPHDPSYASHHKMSITHPQHPQHGQMTNGWRGDNMPRVKGQQWNKVPRPRTSVDQRGNLEAQHLSDSMHQNFHYTHGPGGRQGFYTTPNGAAPASYNSGGGGGGSRPAGAGGGRSMFK
jgi:hypothetical protein